MRPIRATFAAVVLGLAAAACAELPVLERDVCGNGFVEPGEACDTADAATCHPPDSATPCRWKCDTKEDCGVRAGTSEHAWVCGLDSVCRAPSGSFDFTTQIPVDVAAVTMTDLDGDGRSEVTVTGTTGTNVYAVNADGSLASVISVPVVTTTPSTGLLHADLFTGSLAFPITGLGLGVVDGRADGTVAPRFDPSFLFEAPDKDLKVVGVSFLPPPPGVLSESFLAIATLEESNGSGDRTGALMRFAKNKGERLLNFDAVELDPFPPVDSTLPALTSIPTGQLDGVSPCGHIVFPGAGKAGAVVLPACEPNGMDFDDPDNDLTNHGVVVLLPDAEDVIAGRAFIIDLNKDGRDDVLFTVAHPKSVTEPAGSNGKLAYVLGATVGIFGGGAQIVQAGTYVALAPETSVEGLAPLAVGDFNGDDGVDFVTQGGIQISKGKWDGVEVLNEMSFGPEEINAPDGVEWTEAIVEDLNSDGLPDVAAGSLSRGGVDVYINAKAPAFHRFKLPTTGGIHDLVTGDFNGDFLRDLAFTMTSGGNPLTRTLMLSYGRLIEPPHPPVMLGDLGNVWQLVPVDRKVPQRLDEIKDMLVVRRDDPAGPLGLSIAYGDTAAGLLCPLILVDPSDSTGGLHGAPLATAIGSFGGAAGVAVVTRGETYDVAEVLLVSAGDGELRVGKSKPVEALLTSQDISSVRAVDLDGDGLQELLIQAAFGAPMNPEEFDAGVKIARVAANTSEFVLDEGRLSAGPYTAFLYGLVTGDIDGDGFVDAAAMVYDFVLKDERMLVFWNVPGSSGRTLSDPVDVPVPVLKTSLWDIRFPILANVDGDQAMEILYTNVDPDPEIGAVFHTYSIGTSLDRTFVDNGFLPDLDTIAVASGDVDGDRIDDVITAWPGLIFVYRGVERAP